MSIGCGCASDAFVGFYDLEDRLLMGGPSASYKPLLRIGVKSMLRSRLSVSRTSTTAIEARDATENLGAKSARLLGR